MSGAIAPDSANSCRELTPQLNIILIAQETTLKTYNDVHPFSADKERDETKLKGVFKVLGLDRWREEGRDD